MRVEEAFPAIVPKDQFQSVNKLLRSRASKADQPRRIASSYLLSGLITCYRCKMAFTGHGAKSGRFHYYVCQSLIKRGSGTCDSPRLNARRFEQVIVGRIRSSILAKDGDDDMTTVVIKELDRLVQEQRGRMEIIESELKDVRRRLDRLWDFVESTDDDLADTASPRIRKIGIGRYASMSRCRRPMSSSPSAERSETMGRSCPARPSSTIRSPRPRTVKAQMGTPRNWI